MTDLTCVYVDDDDHVHGVLMQYIEQQQRDDDHLYPLYVRRGKNAMEMAICDCDATASDVI